MRWEYILSDSCYYFWFKCTWPKCSYICWVLSLLSVSCLRVPSDWQPATCFVAKVPLFVWELLSLICWTISISFALLFWVTPLLSITLPHLYSSFWIWSLFGWCYWVLDSVFPARIPHSFYTSSWQCTCYSLFWLISVISPCWFSSNWVSSF